MSPRVPRPVPRVAGVSDDCDESAVWAHCSRCQTDPTASSDCDACGESSGGVGSVMAPLVHLCRFYQALALKQLQEPQYFPSCAGRVVSADVEITRLPVEQCW